MKLIVGGVYHDTAWLNIYHVQYTGSAPSSSNINAYLTAIGIAVENAYGAEMSVDNQVTTLEGIDLSSDTGASSSITVSYFGLRTGDFVPASVAVVASFEIARRYRGGHPRKYLPWGTAGTYATGSTKDWDPGFITDCQSKLATMLDNLVGVTEGSTTWATNVNVSYRNAGVVRPAAVIDPIESVIVRSRICSQRRRLGKVGG